VLVELQALVAPTTLGTPRRAVLPESARGDSGGDAGLSLNTVSGLTSLVADIAARGSARTKGDNGKSTAPEKSAVPARFQRQER
jgi:DNA repair protein RadA/Sms